MLKLNNPVRWEVQNKHIIKNQKGGVIMTPRKLKVAALSVVVIIALCFVAALGVITKEDKSTPLPATGTSVQGATEEVAYKGVGGKTALQLLKEEHAVLTQKYDGMGEFVTTIDGVKPDSKHFWALYVNGKQSQVGADKLQTLDGDQIAWKLEEIK